MAETSTVHPAWLGLTWSAWMPLMAAHPLALAQLPSHPGLLRIRRANDPDVLCWVGWASSGVRQTAERLSRQVHLPVPPFDDPAVPAIALWQDKRTHSTAFEISGATPTDGTEDHWKRLVATYSPTL
jgi:hypothetical protein